MSTVSTERVLVVEDNDKNLKLTRDILEYAGFTVAVATTGEDAVAQAEMTVPDIILMDDPMRGVDVGTKREVYGLIRQEAARGRTFLWYTTETDELEHCDHVYVFREGAIVADLSREELTEEKLLHASFRDDA